MRVIGWNFQTPDPRPQKSAVQMNGHNTPVRAQTQMTKQQNATANGTPANPLWTLLVEAVTRTVSDGGATSTVR